MKPPLRLKIQALYDRWISSLRLLREATGADAKLIYVDDLNDVYERCLELKYLSPANPYLCIILSRPIKEHLLLAYKMREAP